MCQNLLFQPATVLKKKERKIFGQIHIDLFYHIRFKRLFDSEDSNGLTGSAVITHDMTTGTGYCLVGFNWIIDFLN